MSARRSRGGVTAARPPPPSRDATTATRMPTGAETASMDLVLDVDDDLYERLARRAESQGFESPEDYAHTVLDTVLDELESGERRATATDDDVQERLEDLGYL